MSNIVEIWKETSPEVQAQRRVEEATALMEKRLPGIMSDLDDLKKIVPAFDFRVVQTTLRKIPFSGAKIETTVGKERFVSFEESAREAGNALVIVASPIEKAAMIFGTRARLLFSYTSADVIKVVADAIHAMSDKTPPVAANEDTTALEPRGLRGLINRVSQLRVFHR